jgi:rubrerythrin
LKRAYPEQSAAIKQGWQDIDSQAGKTSNTMLVTMLLIRRQIMYYDGQGQMGTQQAPGARREPMGTDQPPMGMGRGPGMGQGPDGMGMGPGMGRGFSFSDTALINDIQKAIIGEVHAYNFYERLAQLADSAQDRQVILSIQNDERRHYHWFTMILARLGGQQPEIPPAELPRRFEDGLRTAIRDELTAAAFYQDIAYRADSRPIEMHFMHASHDEQRHASWLQYLLNH